MLKINDLEVQVNEKKILSNFNLNINDGEIHVIMGPNGIGKSTICKTIMGDSNYQNKKLQEICQMLGLLNNFIHREINVGMSGGERKKNELMHMWVLEPSLILLDELDSGLDVDALKLCSENIMKYYQKYKPSILIITHHTSILDVIKPDFVHVIKNGRIVKTGSLELAKQIENEGFNGANEVEKKDRHE